MRLLICTTALLALGCADAGADPGPDEAPIVYPGPSGRATDPAVTRNTLDGPSPTPGDRIDAWGADVVLRDEDVAIGEHLVMPGDLDGDGVDDLVVTAIRDDHYEGCHDVDPPSCVHLTQHEVRIYYGGSAVAQGAPDAVLLTPIVPGRTLYVAAAGDVDGDGLADLLVGLDTHAGPAPVTLLYGGPRRAGEAPLQSAGPLLRHGEANTGLAKVVGLGDLDGDGYADFALGGAPGVPLHVFYGRPARWVGAVQADLAADATIHLTDDAQLWGVAAGDLDGDGLDDLLVRVRGEAGGAARLHRVAGQEARLEGAVALADAGTSIAGITEVLGALGDLDGDGRAELGLETEDGLTVIAAGRAEWPDGVDLSVAARAQLHLPADQVETRGPGGCRTMARAGDVTGDGWPDVLCGHEAAYVGGAAYVVPGREGGLRGDVSLEREAIAFLGRHIPREALAEGEAAGAFVVGGSDINHDGVDDFAFGADFLDYGVLRGSATCHVVFGWRAGR